MEASSCGSGTKGKCTPGCHSQLGRRPQEAWCVPMSLCIPEVRVPCVCVLLKSCSNLSLAQGKILELSAPKANTHSHPCKEPTTPAFFFFVQRASLTLFCWSCLPLQIEGPIKALPARLLPFVPSIIRSKDPSVQHQLRPLLQAAWRINSVPSCMGGCVSLKAACSCSSRNHVPEK